MRVYNFSAGPAQLPLPVLEQAAAELTDWRGSGMSVLEVSHRGKDFVECAADAEATLRSVAGIPDDYRVLFLAGGATGQFSAIPANLTAPGDPAAGRAARAAGRDEAVVRGRGNPPRSLGPAGPPARWRRGQRVVAGDHPGLPA